MLERLQDQERDPFSVGELNVRPRTKYSGFHSDGDVDVVFDKLRWYWISYDAHVISLEEVSDPFYLLLQRAGGNSPYGASNSN